MTGIAGMSFLPLDTGRGDVAPTTPGGSLSCQPPGGFSFDWGRLSPAEDALVWAMRADGRSFAEIGRRIEARRAFPEKWDKGAEKRVPVLAAARARLAADVAWRSCAHCNDRFRIRPSREDFRLCLPCRKHA